MSQPIVRRFRESTGDAPGGDAPVSRPFASSASWFAEAAADRSLDDRLQAVSSAVHRKYSAGLNTNYDGPWTECTFEDFVIVRKGKERWRLDYTIDKAGTVTLGEPQAVAIKYEPIKESVQEGAEVGERVITTQCVLGPLADDGSLVESVEGAVKPSGKQWGVVIIREGMSINRRHYRRQALTEAAPLYEGARIFADHQEQQRRFGRSVNECIGFIKDVKPVFLHPEGGAKESTVAPVMALVGTACITKAAWRQELMEAYEMGNPNLYGFSHDALCEGVTAMGTDKRPFSDVTRIRNVSSVDLVINPAAGGRLMQLVASDTLDPTLQEDGRMLQKMLEAIKASGNAALIARLGDTPDETTVLALYGELKATEAVAAAAKEAAGKCQKCHGALVDGKCTACVKEAVETTQPGAGATQAGAVQFSEAEIGAMRKKFGELQIDTNLAGCSLPKILKERLRTRLMQSVEAITEDAIVATIREEVETYGALAKAGVVLPATAPQIALGAGPSEKFVEAFDAFFDMSKNATSFRELYIQFTGDERVTGRVEHASRLRESIGSSTFDQGMADVLNKRMAKEYSASPLQNWRGVIADVVPLSDFRTQRRVRMGGYGNLPTVGEGAPYTALTTPGDEQATYAPAKRGGTESITLEAIKNDDVAILRRIPGKMARAAAQTLHEFVWDFLATNAAIYDTTALAVAGHNNLSTTALSSAQLAVARLMIKKQADMSNGKRLGLVAKHLIVPSDLEETGYVILKTQKLVNSPNNDESFIAKQGIQLIVVDYWTDANNWWCTGDPSQGEMIEVGFLDGQEEPQLFLQDNPTAGSMFSNDKLTYKIRHIYGGAVIDYRLFVGGIVA